MIRLSTCDKTNLGYLSYPGVDKAKEKALDIKAKLQQALEIIDDKNKIIAAKNKRLASQRKINTSNKTKDLEYACKIFSMCQARIINNL